MVSQKVKNRVLHEFRNINHLLALKDGILVICSCCIRVRDKDGDWWPVDTYLLRQGGVDFSHTICRECKRELYPDIQ
jgi:hypothetical protein